MNGPPSIVDGEPVPSHLHRILHGLHSGEQLLYLIGIFSGDEMDTAKVFWSGRSQAIRLPKAYRLDGKEVRIRRHGTAVILEPLAEEWAWLDALVRPLDQDFVDAATESVGEQKRPAIDDFFR
jgi:antitoxin VapB